jgi:sulfur relay (sulfurtransferase) complex TusBCD TusD component (DsrE family)
MGKLLIILFTPPWQSQNTDTVYELAKAALEEGHEATVFCDVEATYNLMKNQTMSANKIAQLIKQGVKVLVCRESARVRGIDTKGGLIEGVVESSLGKLAELMEQNDRVVSFG